jgi:hypothetical protein
MRLFRLLCQELRLTEPFPVALALEFPAPLDGFRPGRGFGFRSGLRRLRVRRLLRFDRGWLGRNHRRVAREISFVNQPLAETPRHLGPVAATAD